MDTKNDIQKQVSDRLSSLSGHKIVVGAKQLKKDLTAGNAHVVFLAENADPAITEPLEALCQQYQVPCVWVRSKTELGRACGIEVGAAAAAAVD